MNNELLNLTYGCIVRQIIEDCEEEENQVNKQLESLGFNMGGRMIDEFLATTQTPNCKKFEHVAEKTCEGFKIFLGVEAKIDSKSKTDQSFVIQFKENPLTRHIVIPEKYKNLHYSNILCGIIRGALEAVNMRVKCSFISDESSSNFKQDFPYEIKVELQELIKKKLKDYED